MAQVLRLMLEEREAARAKRQANLATLQHLAQLATNNNNNNGGNGNDEPQTKLWDFQNSNPPTFTKSSLWMPMIGSELLKISLSMREWE
jgi:hypothetical protein